MKLHLKRTFLIGFAFFGILLLWQVYDLWCPTFLTDIFASILMIFSALVYNCSFPMVVELCSANEIGKFTGYYYTSSMAAQTLTPVLLGLLLFKFKAWGALPFYAAVFLMLSAIVFILLVKNISGKSANANELEALGNED